MMTTKFWAEVGFRRCCRRGVSSPHGGQPPPLPRPEFLQESARLGRHPPCRGAPLELPLQPPQVFRTVNVTPGFQNRAGEIPATKIAQRVAKSKAAAPAHAAKYVAQCVAPSLLSQADQVIPAVPTRPQHRVTELQFVEALANQSSRKGRRVRPDHNRPRVLAEKATQSALETRPEIGATLCDQRKASGRRERGLSSSKEQIAVDAPPQPARLAKRVRDECSLKRRCAMSSERRDETSFACSWGRGAREDGER